MLRLWLVEFAHDDKLTIALILLVLDFILGVAAAVKLGTFRLSYLADFARNDILFKLVPWFVFYVLALVAGGVDIVIPGFDLGFIAAGIYTAMLAAFTGSILASAQTLGLPLPTPPKMRALFAGENVGPPKN